MVLAQVLFSSDLIKDENEAEEMQICVEPMPLLGVSKFVERRDGND